jgi:hypothetical protein
MALGPTLLGLKRAAEANKCQRIAGRLATLAGARQARPAYVLDVEERENCRRSARLI